MSTFLYSFSLYKSSYIYYDKLPSIIQYTRVGGLLDEFSKICDKMRSLYKIANDKNLKITFVN